MSHEGVTIGGGKPLFQLVFVAVLPGLQRSMENIRATTEFVAPLKGVN